MKLIELFLKCPMTRKAALRHLEKKREKEWIKSEWPLVWLTYEKDAEEIGEEAEDVADLCRQVRMKNQFEYAKARHQLFYQHKL